MQYQRRLPQPPKCKECYRECFPVDVIEQDKKTKKRYVITMCPQCGYKSDIEELDLDNPFK